MTNIKIRPDYGCRPKRFQFSIGSLLVLTAVVAFLASLVYTIPDPISTYAFVFLILTVPAILISILTYGTPYQKTFAVGALLPCVCYLYVFLPVFRDALNMRGMHSSMQRLYGAGGGDLTTQKLYAIAVWGASAGSGLLAVLVRRRIETPSVPPAVQQGTEASGSSNVD